MARLASPFSRPGGVPGSADAAALVIRIVVGVIMTYHGYRKIQDGVSGFVDFVGTLDVPVPTVVGYAVVVIEFVGGLSILAGLLTRLWGLLLALQMVAIVFVVKWDTGLIAPQGAGAGYELDLAIAAGALALVLMGPGRVSLDRVLGLERAAPATT